MSVKTGQNPGFILEVRQISNVNLRKAELAGSTIFGGRFQGRVFFDDASVDGILDLCECIFEQQPNFPRTLFSFNTKLLLARSRIAYDLELAGNSLPSLITLDGATIQGQTSIKAEMCSTQPTVLAAEHVPGFGQGAVFSNTDLTNCRLAGNDISLMKFTNVKWPIIRGRNVIYDDIAFRHGAIIPAGHIKETYQVLKQWYQSMGNQARAGDFHYGEMEMKRREKGWPRRILCPEFFYWALNGYSNGWLRALVLLLFMIFGAGWGYLWTSGVAFDSQFSNALLFSFQVISFQKPVPPREFSTWSEWIRIAETIFVPIQAALFAIALRNRLKR